MTIGGGADAESREVMDVPTYSYTPEEPIIPIVWDDDVPLLTVLDMIRREKEALNGI